MEIFEHCLHKVNAHFTAKIYKFLETIKGVESSQNDIDSSIDEELRYRTRDKKHTEAMEQSEQFSEFQGLKSYSIDIVFQKTQRTEMVHGSRTVGMLGNGLGPTMGIIRGIIMKIAVFMMTGVMKTTKML